MRISSSLPQMCVCVVTEPCRTCQACAARSTRCSGTRASSRARTRARGKSPRPARTPRSPPSPQKISCGGKREEPSGECQMRCADCMRCAACDKHARKHGTRTATAPRLNAGRIVIECSSSYQEPALAPGGVDADFACGCGLELLRVELAEVLLVPVLDHLRLLVRVHRAASATSPGTRSALSSTGFLLFLRHVWSHKTKRVQSMREGEKRERKFVFVGSNAQGSRSQGSGSQQRLRLYSLRR